MATHLQRFFDLPMNSESKGFLFILNFFDIREFRMSKYFPFLIEVVKRSSRQREGLFAQSPCFHLMDSNIIISRLLSASILNATDTPFNRWKGFELIPTRWPWHRIFIMTCSSREAHVLPGVQTTNDRHVRGECESSVLWCGWLP